MLTWFGQSFANLSKLVWLQKKPEPEVSSVQTHLFSVLFPKYFNLQLKAYQKFFFFFNFEPWKWDCIWSSLYLIFESQKTLLEINWTKDVVIPHPRKTAEQMHLNNRN